MLEMASAEWLRTCRAQINKGGTKPPLLGELRLALIECCRPVMPLTSLFQTIRS